MRTTIEQTAIELFNAKYGRRVDTRFEKLREEVNELFDAYEKYKNQEGRIENILDELSDTEAVLNHIRSIISLKSHDQSIMDAILKVRIREHNKQYLK